MGILNQEKLDMKKNRVKINIILLLIFIISVVGGMYSELITIPKRTRIIYEKRLPIYKISKFMVDSDENYYIGTEFNTWIQVFNKDGKYLYTIGTYAKSVYDFYIDSYGLLNIVIPNINSDGFTVDVIDLNKKEKVDEKYETNEYVENNITYFDNYNTFVNENKYELDYDKIIINNKIVKLEDVPKLPLPGSLCFRLSSISFIMLIFFNNDYLKFFDFTNSKNFYRIK